MKPKEVTITTLKDATAQEVFDHVAYHLLTQLDKCRGMLGEQKNACLYRNDEGLKCAAGSLFTEEEYNNIKPDTNHGLGTDWGQQILQNNVSSEHEELISELQSIHDYIDVDYWFKELAVVAKKYKLTFNTDYWAQVQENGEKLKNVS